MFRSRGIQTIFVLCLVFLSIPAEAGFFRRLFRGGGGAFAGGRRARFIPQFRSVNPSFGNRRFNRLSQFNPQLAGLGSHGINNFGLGGLGIGIDPFADPLDPLSGLGLAQGSGRGLCAQLQFDTCEGETGQGGWACTALTGAGNLLDVTEGSKCLALRRLRLEACRVGADPLAIDKWHTSCRRVNGGFVEQWGAFSGAAGTDFASEQIIVGLQDEAKAEKLFNWLKGKKGVTQWHRFNNRKLALIQVPAGQEAEMCSAIKEWDAEGSVASCNPNLFITGTTGSGAGLGTFAGAFDPTFTNLGFALNNNFGFGGGRGGLGGGRYGGGINNGLGIANNGLNNLNNGFNNGLNQFGNQQLSLDQLNALSGRGFNNFGQQGFGTFNGLNQFGSSGGFRNFSSLNNLGFGGFF